MGRRCVAGSQRLLPWKSHDPGSGSSGRRLLLAAEHLVGTGVPRLLKTSSLVACSPFSVRGGAFLKGCGRTLFSSPNWMRDFWKSEPPDFYPNQDRNRCLNLYGVIVRGCGEEGLHHTRECLEEAILPLLGWKGRS